MTLFSRVCACDACATPVRDASRRRRDPTNTLTLRLKFRGDVSMRFRALRRLVIDSIVDKDFFGLSSVSTQGVINAMMLGNNRLSAFNDWLYEAERRLVIGGNAEWMRPYVRRAYLAGVHRAEQLVGRRVELDVDAREEIIFGLARSELDGLVEAANQQSSRVLASALIARQRPRAIAAAVVDRLDKVGLTRARSMSQTIIVHAHATATLDAFRAAGVGRVGVQAEGVRVARPPLADSIAAPGNLISLFDAARRAKAKARPKKKKARTGEFVSILTAGDTDVCPECEDLEGQVMTLDEAYGTIPVHPNCRCVFVPEMDERFAENDPSE